MKVRHLAAAIVISVGLGTALHAQASGDLNKTAHVSKTAKRPGHTKKKAHHGASHRQVVATKAGTKAELKRAVGVTTKRHSVKHKAGGANKPAHKVSQAGKAVKQTSTKADAALTKAGKDNKEAIKKP